ncbi:MAG: 23S rRNA (adenine(2503)-C(2))-methyltransferase RlmN [Planctomycetaceae bacterium]
MPETVSIFDAAAVESLRKQLRLDPQRIRAFRNSLLKKFLPDETALQDVSDSDRWSMHCLELFRRCDSELDGASKLLFRTATGMLIEAVILRIATGRTTLCVSSQVGCAAACDFCATGRMGIAQNLSAAEILDQVLQAGQLLTHEQRRLQNIVFMGMGEPFHNETQLYAALEILTAPDQFDRTPGSILISTVGIPDAMLRCAEQFPRINLALSLHSARQDIRESMIPLAKKYPLAELKETLQQINRHQEREVMLEYLMLAGRNDSPGDADALIEWAAGLQVHLNLIPFNAIDDAPHLTATPPDKISEFANRLKAAGLKTTIRYSLGSDIAAACGQLVRRENRRHAMESHP